MDFFWGLLLLRLMKKKFAFLNVMLMIAVLFSMLFQSLHSFEHLAKQLAEKKCLHEYNSSHEITHQHHNFDHCFVCEFTFASFISPETRSYKLHSEYSKTPRFFTLTETPKHFSGSSYFLRGPPAFIV